MAADTEIDPIRYGVLYQDVQNLKKSHDDLKEDVEKMGDKIDQLLELANRSKGALWVVMMILGTGTALIGLIYKLVKGG